MRPAVKPLQKEIKKVSTQTHKKPTMSADPLFLTLPSNCPARLQEDDLEHPERFRRRLAEWLMRQK